MLDRQDGTVLWEPPADAIAHARLTNYLAWLRDTKQLHFPDYESARRWSIEDLSGFWQSIWDYFGVQGHPGSIALRSMSMPGTEWFPDATTNFAQHLLRNAGGQRPALIAVTEQSEPQTISWDELLTQSASLAASLKGLGVKAGDRVVGYLPNIPETTIAFIAAASLGAIWSSCAPEFGAQSVLDRFRQIEPLVLFVANGYRYGGRVVDRRAAVAQLRDGLPSVKHVIHVPYPERRSHVPADRTIGWSEMIGRSDTWNFELLPFNHPLWILYSSGTTGLPKPIVHSHGGVLLEHLKAHGLHLDLRATDRFFWFTSTGWVMWNLLVSGLLMGATIVLYDGSPTFPDPDCLWTLVDRLSVTTFGASAGFFMSCMKRGLKPRAEHDLRVLRCLGSTGSPLPAEAFEWIYRDVKNDLWVMSFSGGTDVASAFVGGNPLLPVRSGEMQCRWLGVDCLALDASGAVTTGMGELVIRQPMPSMPLMFWNDDQGSRYRDSYFDVYPGVWRHGDWVEFTRSGGAIVHGRSDSTINRRGVRMGTSEIYRVIETMPEVADSLAVELPGPDGSSNLVVFLVLHDEGQTVSDDLKDRMRTSIRADLSPRHVPDEFVAVPAIPRTLNGKKLEVPVKRVLLGAPIEKVANLDAVMNPEALEYFLALRETRTW